MRPNVVPDNVLILPFLPQSDILGVYQLFIKVDSILFLISSAHPKVKLFITHCGVHGSLEGIHHGVKMVTIPLFFEQTNNAAVLAERGVAKTVYTYASKTELYETITTVLYDKRY